MMKRQRVAFIGNWNNLPFSIGFGLCNFLPGYSVRVVNTRKKPRNTPHFSGLEFNQTGSVLSAIDLDIETTQANVRQGKFVINSELLSTITWADIIFVCGEMYYLALLVRDKPVIGIPIGFEFENFGNTDKENEIPFRKALASCTGYLMRDDFTGFAREYFIKNGLEDRRLRYPSFPVPFELAGLLMSAKGQRAQRMDYQYIFYATRITADRGDIDSADNKGSSKFFKAILPSVPFLKSNSIKLVVIDRDETSRRVIEKISPILGDVLITVPEQPYAGFLGLAANAILAIDSFGAGGIPHGTTSDSLAVCTPVLSAFNFSNAESLSLVNHGLHKVVFDAAFDDYQDQELCLFRAVKAALENKRPIYRDLRKSIDSSDKFTSDMQFTRKLGTYIGDLVEAFR